MSNHAVNDEVAQLMVISGITGMLYELSKNQKIQEKLKVINKPSSSRISEVAPKPQGVVKVK